MKICPSCGSELDDDLSFCPADGSPLLDQEDPGDGEAGIGDETVVMGSDEPAGEEPDEDIGDATVVMGDVTKEEIETVVPDRTAEEPADEADPNATMVMPHEPVEAGGAEEAEVPSEDISPVPDDTMFADADSGEEEWVAVDDDDSEEWTEEADDTTGFTVPVAEDGDWDDADQEDDEASAGVAEPEPEEKKRSYVGLIIGLVLLFFAFVVILVGAFGVWWYMSTQRAEVAANEANLAANEMENANLEEDDPFDDLESNMDDLSNSNANEDDADEEDDPTPTPSRTPTPTRTPTPSPTSTPIRNDDPRPTPTPVRTPRRTPTPIRSTPTPTIPSRVSRGVVNGQAVSLPRPAYPSAARAVNAKGRVNVSVIINRQGRVISATATSGHPLLRSAAVGAARRARFRPTLVSGQPVEVSGVIVYNFQ